jgi:lysophospholipase L1-like esterase
VTDNEKSRRRNPRLSVRVAAIVLFWSIPLLVGFVAAELYARNIGLYRRWSYPLSRIPFSELDRAKVWNRRYYEGSSRFFREWPAPLEFFESDKPTPRYLWRPNTRLVRRGNTLVQAGPNEATYFSTNSWGFRGSDLSTQKPADVIRVICLGASTTGGSQSDRETYPYFLQLELSRLFPRQKIEVINAGHHGTSIDDLFEILKSRVLPLDPDMVIFYESSNNIDWSEFISDTPLRCPQQDCWLTQYPAFYRALYRRSALFSLIADRSDWRRARPMPHRLSIDGPKTSLVHYRNVLADIAKETMAHGATIMLTSFVTVADEGLEISPKQNIRFFDEVEKTMYPFTPGEVASVYSLFNQQAREVAVTLGTPFADLATEFPKDLQYFPYDYIHFSPEGNRMLAVLLVRHLMKDALPAVIAKRQLDEGLYSTSLDPRWNAGK